MIPHLTYFLDNIFIKAGALDRALGAVGHPVDPDTLPARPEARVKALQTRMLEVLREQGFHGTPVAGTDAIDVWDLASNDVPALEQTKDLFARLADGGHLVADGRIVARGVGVAQVLKVEGASLAVYDGLEDRPLGRHQAAPAIPEQTALGR